MLQVLPSGRRFLGHASVQAHTKRTGSLKRKQHRRTLWGFLKTEEVSKLDELDTSDPLVASISPARAIPVVKRISAEEFYKNYRKPELPVIIKGIVREWPAATKWKDPHYFSTTFPRAQVPIEVGGHYLDSHWTQKLVSFKDFIDKYITLEDRYVANFVGVSIASSRLSWCQ